MCKKFPSLLCTVYDRLSNTEAGENNSDENIVASYVPEKIYNLLIANSTFGFLKSCPNIKRRHGRLGLLHVHVMQFPDVSPTSSFAMKRLRYLSHTNVLKCYYLTENASKM